MGFRTVARWKENHARIPCFRQASFRGQRFERTVSEDRRQKTEDRGVCGAVAPEKKTTLNPSQVSVWLFFPAFQGRRTILPEKKNATFSDYPAQRSGAAAPSVAA
jgi:hypothetical protein